MALSTMSSRERMLAAITRQGPDHIPFSPYIGQGPWWDEPFRWRGQLERARITRAKVEIQAMSLAINHYYFDVGEYPISSTGSLLAPGTPNPTAPFVGNGYMQTAILRSMNGFPFAPLDPRWKGPYQEFDMDQLGTLSGAAISSSTALPQIQILDPWGTPYYYCRAGELNSLTFTPSDYLAFGGTRIPASNPLANYETYFNWSTFQLISFGPDRQSPAHPLTGLGPDDITNF